MFANSPSANSLRAQSKRRCKYTVLWVDDDPNVTAAVTRQLLRHSIRVIPAPDGMVGYWMALNHRPDVIVTDLRMPRWEGDELVNHLQQNKNTCGVPTIVLSGYADAISDSFCHDHGVVAVLDKPVSFPTLLATIQSCLDSNAA